MSTFSKQKREEAENLCLSYLDNGEYSDYLAIAMLGLIVGYEEICPDSVLGQLSTGELEIRGGIIWNIENHWDDTENEIFEPFVKLKEQVKGNIDSYEASVDWVLIERLWNGCLTKLGCEPQ